MEKTEKPIERLRILKKLTKNIHNSYRYKGNRPYIAEFKKLAERYKKDSLIVQSSLYLSESYIINEENEKAKKVIIDAIEKESKFPDFDYRLSNQLARIYHAQENYEKAIEIWKRTINKYEEKPTGSVIVYLYNNLASSYGMLKRGVLEEKAIIKGIEFAKKLKKKELEIDGSHKLACKLMEIKNYKKAEKHLLETLSLVNKYHIENERGYVYRTLGLNYSRWGKYKKSLQYNILALDILQKNGDKRYAFDVMNSIAVTYNRMNNLKKSIIYGKKTLVAANELNHPLAIRAAKNTLAVAYKNNKDYSKSLKLFQQIAKDTIDDQKRNIDFKITLLNNLSDIYFAQNKHKKSLVCFKRKTFLQDSLNNEQDKSKIVEFETKYQTEKKEKENLQLKQEKSEQQLQLAKENQQKWILGLGLLTSLLVLGVFGYYYKRNQQQKTLIEGLQKELHHRVKNNLSIIDRFVEVLKDEFNEPKFTLKLTELQNRIASINEVHQQLYSSKDVTQLHMKTYIEKLANNVQKSFPNHTINIHKQIDNNLELTSTKSFPLGIIINEFLTNSYKYAFGDSKKGNINIEMKENKQNYILNLSDSGKGLPNGFDIKADANFGLRIVRLLCMQINATFRIKNENGMQLVIEMPKN